MITFRPCFCRLLSAAILFGFLGGCLPGQPPEPASASLPAPSPSSTLTPTPTATATPTIAPTPTPTPQPSQRLDAGRRAQANGDYSRAILEYGALLADHSLSGEEARRAQLLLGECQLLAEEYESAIATLRDFLANYADDPQAPTAQFLLARAYERAERWDEAIAAYRGYLEKRDIIASYVNERIGDIAVQKGDCPAAIEAYRAALNDASDDSAAVNLRERIAECYLKQEEFAKATQEYDAILAVAKIPAYRAKILHLAGLAYKEWDRPEEAQARFEQAVTLYPDTWDAYLALVELVNAGVAVDEYQRGLVDYYAGAYDPAIQAFRRYLDSEAPKGLGNAYYFLALSYQAAGQYRPAIETFQIVIDKYAGHKHWADAWLEQAASWAQAGDVKKAVSVYRRFAADYPDRPEAPTALWKSARWLEEAGEPDAAAKAYAELQRSYPQSEHAAEALLHAALNHYRLRAYSEASSLLQLLSQEYPQTEEALAGRFWLSKALLAAGDDESGRAGLRQVAAEAPLDFYGLRAAMLLSATNTITMIQVMQTPVTAPGRADPTTLPEEGEGQAEAETWLRTWITGTVTGPLSALPPALEESLPFRRAEELMAVGLRREALAEYEKVRDAWIEDPRVVYAMAIAFRDRGAYRLSIGCAERLLRLSPTGHFKAPPFMQRLAYPTYYGDLIASEARAQGFDPLLYFALIRQESLFEPDAGSRAGARGLAQVMPDTGDYIASRTGWADYKQGDLGKPYVSAFFGAWYFAQALRMFDGNPFAALAAYNAGPGNAIRWHKIAPDDIDIFIEEIDLRETRYYVESVYEQYALYTFIY
jgi:soluble lytic murein transglycosylase